MINNTQNIYCIIVTYNGAKWIEKCFGSLMQSTIPLKIIVIDNASSDNTVALIKEKFSLVDIIESATNLGFGQANNAGIKRALEQNADYVFLLNQDTWIKNDTVEKLINTAVENPEYGIISPFHLNYEGSAIEKYFNDFVIGYYTPGYINDIQFGTLKTIYSSSFIHCAAWLLSTATVKKIGGFDPLFFHYGEDNDYVQRLLYRQMKIGFVPGSILFHYGTNDGLNDPAKNIPFKVNQALVKLKAPNASVTGTRIVFIKNSLDAMTTAIFLYRNSKTLKTEWKVFWYNFKRLNRIAKSAKAQKMEMAYLNN